MSSYILLAMDFFKAYISPTSPESSAISTSPESSDYYDQSDEAGFSTVRVLPRNPVSAPLLTLIIRSLGAYLSEKIQA